MHLPAVRFRAGRWRLPSWIRVPVLIATVLFGLSLPVLGGAFLAEYPLVEPAVSVSTESRPLLGAYHVHSVRSDGRADVGEIAAAAKRAGLDFVVMTDHNLEPLPAAERREGVLLVPGIELSTPHGHVVGLGLSRGLTQAERDASVLERITSLGGQSVLAHPAQRKRPWTDWTGAAQHAAGFELYSGDTMLRGALESPVSILAPAALSFLVNPSHGLLTLVRAAPGAHERLLSLASARPTAALCAHDAHGIPSYESMFRAMQMTLSLPPLPEDAAQAAALVSRALASGEGLCVFPPLGAADGFAIDGLQEGRREAHVGDTLRLSLPQATPADVRIVVFGPARLKDERTVFLSSPGAVQIEVWVRVPYMLGGDGWRPWIVPSPIRVVEGAPAGTSP